MFKKGVSGNPQGRKPGPPKVAWRSLVQASAKELIGRTVELALAGDIQCLLWCVNRLIPPAKEDPVVIDTSGTLTDCGRRVLDAVGQSMLTIDQGARLLSTLADQAKLVEVDELAREVAELKAWRLRAEGPGGDECQE